MSDPISDLIDAAEVLFDDPPEGGPPEPVDEDRGAYPAAEFHERVRRCARLLQNDTDNGLRLRVWFGERILVVRDIGWHAWTGTHWDPEGAGERVRRLAQQTAKLIAHETIYIEPTSAEAAAIARMRDAKGKPESDRDEADTAAIRDGEAAAASLGKRRGNRRAFSISSGNGARLTAMINEAEPHVTHAVGEMDRDGYAFNVRNGTLRFVRGPAPFNPRSSWHVDLQPHDPAELITKCAPVDYLPDAEAPSWIAFMERFQPGEAVRTFLRDYHGYALLGVMGAQQLVFNYGEGANGKSTFIEALSRLMGPYARTLNPESITGGNQRNAGAATPDLAQLPGARMVRVSELPRGVTLKEDLVKALTGGEPMMVRHNFGNFFEFRPTFKPSMSGNDKPTIHGVDYGIWRRMRLVPWTQTIGDHERRDMEDVLGEFMAEGAGVLNWLVAGALDYLERGRLAVPQEIVDATAEYRAEMDPIQTFLNECVTQGLDHTNRVQARTMYGAYEKWARANAVKSFSETLFGKTLSRKGIPRAEGAVRHWLGVKLHDVPEGMPVRHNAAPGPESEADYDV